MPSGGGSGPSAGDWFVGRDAELSTLRDALARAQAGDAVLSLVTGEAGIGKTRLVEQLAARARAQGVRVVWGRCWEDEGAPAFWPWRQVLQALARSVDTAAMARQMPSAIDALARLAPDIAPSATLPDDVRTIAEARFRLFEAVAAFLDRASRTRALLIILEDLHWADLASLILLRFVVRQGTATRRLIVGTYRDFDGAGGAPLTEVLGALARDGQRVPLHGLTAVETVDFIQAATEVRAAADVVGAVLQRTEGNPLFLAEIVRDLCAHADPLTWDAEAIVRLPTPTGLRAALRQRVDRLSPASRAALQLAAACGVEFDADVVEEAFPAAGIHAAAADAFGEAVAAGVLHHRGGRRRSYRFRHALVRETVYADLAEPERRQLHRHLAAVLEADAASQPGMHLTALARHFLCAGDPPDLAKAADYAARAADEARALLAYEEAAQLYDMAHDALVRGTARSTDAIAYQRRQLDLLVSLGEVQMLAAEKAAARQSFGRAAGLARSLDDSRALARVALGNAGSADVTARIDDAAVALLEEARRGLGSTSPELCAQLLSRLAMTYSFAGTPTQAAALSAEAVSCARQAGDARTLASVISARRFVLLGPDDRAERTQLTAEIVALAEHLGDRDLRGAGEFWRLLDLLEQGDGTAVDASLSRYTRLAEELRQPFLTWRSQVLRTMHHLLTGRFREAEETLEAVRRTGERAHTPNAPLVYGAQLLDLRRQQGRLAEVQALLEPFAAEHAEIGAVRCGLALVHAQLGHLDATRAVLESVVAPGSSGLPRDGTWLGAINALAHVAAILEHREAAAILYDWMRPYADRCIVIGFGDLCHGAVARGLGRLAHLLECWDEAFDHFESALAMNRRLGAAPLLALVQHEFAHMCLACGRSPHNTSPDSLLRAAQASYRALGIEDPLSMPAGRPAQLALPCPPHNIFRREGDYWVVAYAGHLARLRHRRGLHYVGVLLREPGREFHVADLMAGDAATLPRVARPRPHPSGLAVPDAQARAAYRERLVGLEQEAEEAERFHDLARAHAARREIEQLRSELAQRYGMGARARERNPEVERIRKAVAKCIRDALVGVSGAHPTLGRHLQVSLRTGTFCSYAPEQPMQWRTTPDETEPTSR